MPVFQTLKYQGASPELVNGPQDPGEVLHGGTVLTDVAAGATPQATAVTALVPATVPPEDAMAGTATQNKDARKAAANAAALLSQATPEEDIAPFVPKGTAL